MPTRRKHSRSDIILMISAVIFIIGAGFVLNTHSKNIKEARQEQRAKSSSAAHKKATSQSAKKVATMKTVDWKKPSQTYAYPTVTKDDPVVLHVDLKTQRIHITQNSKRVYTMYCSSGMDHATPTGTFHIIDRGKTFYNPKDKMGANYWTSFKGNKYLFHSVPIDKDGHYIVKEAQYLGKRPSSHGCIRLSIPDAKWINEHIPSGTEVIIK
ncbi:L,D-transpeptidase [Lacticaseibacillus sp. GG6-2]